MSSVFSATMERAPLLAALGHAQGIIERRNTVPILANVLLDVQEDSMVLAATDLDLYLRETLSVQQGSGRTTMPLHMLHDIVRKLPDGADIVLTQEDHQISLTSGRAQFSLPALPADDFPVMGRDDFPYRFTIARDALKALLEATRGFMSADATRYYLNGVYLHPLAGDAPLLRAVATDGHRLARTDIDAPQDMDAAMNGIIVPRKTVAEILRLLEEAPEEAVVEISPTKLRLSAGDTTLISKLVDGKYPDYEKAIPQHNSKELKVSTKTLAKAVDRVATVAASEKIPSVKLHLQRDRIRLTSASAADSSKGAEELEASFSEDALDIGFNPRFLMDVLGLVGGETTVFRLNDNASPSVIQAETNARALYVLMPMRI